MIVLDEYKDKQVAVFGGGQTGRSVIRSLQAGGASVMAWDDEESAREEMNELGAMVMHPSGWNWLSLEVLVLSPGIPLTHPEPHEVVTQAKAAGVPVVGDVELFARVLKMSEKDVRIIAITGTNGKSTTTALIAHLFERTGTKPQVGGNIGKPVLELDPPESGSTYVLEISSYQADLTESLRPDVVIFLNLTPDHLDRHGDMIGYMKAKRRLVDMLAPDGKVIVGANSRPTQELCTELTLEHREALIPVAADRVLGNGVFVIDGMLFDGMLPNAEEVANLTDVTSLQGRHNWENAAAAYACLHHFGVERSRFPAIFESFVGLPHRLEPVAAIGKVRYVNDSKATNVEAAARALSAFDEVYWIAGGRGKDEDLSTLLDHTKNVRRAYLIGEASSDLANALKGKVDCIEAETLERAIALASKEASVSKGAAPVVLLSPACASFDQFSNFEARGEAFRTLTEELVGKNDNIVDFPSCNDGGAAA